MGKWWNVQLIFFQIAYFTDIPYLNSMLLTSVTGIERTELSYADFLTQLTERVVNKKLEQLDAYTDQAVPEFTVQAAPGIEGNVEPLKPLAASRAPAGFSPYRSPIDRGTNSGSRNPRPVRS